MTKISRFSWGCSVGTPNKKTEIEWLRFEPGTLVLATLASGAVVPVRPLFENFEGDDFYQHDEIVALAHMPEPYKKSEDINE